MNRLKMRSLNKVEDNIEKIGRLFPNCLTERKNGKEVERVIDFDVLRQELSNVVVDGADERYQFTWPDKKKAILLANSPIASTLRPCREESVDFDSTENLYIEGDNLDVLKLLQETYLGKVKMIYIDPPYNTGNDFVYNDDYSQSTDEYLANSGQYDEEGNRLVQNSESNGRFHTDWLNMIYPRLKVAKDLLSDDGVIFISIGEEELDNLSKVLSEIFGKPNYRNILALRRYDKNLSRQFMDEGLPSLSVGLEYILVYTKNPETKFQPVFRKSNEERATFGYWKGFWNNADRVTMRYDILGYTPEDGQWKWKKEVADEAIENYIIYEKEFATKMTLEEYWDKTGKSKKFIRRNHNGVGKNKGVEHWIHPSDSILRNSNWSDMLVSKPTGVGLTFDSPKNCDLITEIIKFSGCINDDIILDFFSGSATTAHAVMQLNAEDGGNRKFICVQVAELTDEKSEAYKAGYKNICEIGKERIRRAGKKVVSDKKAKGKELFDSEDETKLDVGFRVLKLDSTNMKDVYYTPDKYDYKLFDQTVENIKDDRTPEDLLFQVMLELGVLLSSKIEEQIMDGKRVFNVGNGYLIACFDKAITESTITTIAKQTPYYFVTRDSSMASDAVAVNFEQIFETYSKDTIRKVL